MATVSNQTFQEQLQLRRDRLRELDGNGSNAQVAGLLQEIDLALERLQKGTFGICEVCNGGIEPGHLLSNPMARICIDHLTTDQRRNLEYDLELAHQIQHRLLPQELPRLDGWDIHYHYQPAGLVSGDYCDLIFPEDGTGDVIFLVGDVSGKGVAASMLMAQLHAMFRTLVSVNLPLEKLLASANHLLSESTLSGQFATLMAGRASRSGQVQLVGAGHLPALLAQDSVVRSIPAAGLPLGVFCDSRYSTERLQLAPGDTLVLYTDGLTEASGADGEYGEERLAKLLAARRGHQAREITLACLDDLRNFSGGAKPSDDLTLLVLRRTN
jgi:phosphoserine phosphatase RsbU/P